MKVMQVAAGAALAVAVSSTAVGQEVFPLQGPFYEVSEILPDRAVLLAELPREAPSEPVEFWEWHYYPETQTVSGVRFDSLVIKRRIDCAANTWQALHGQWYLGRTRAWQREGDPVTPVPSGLGTKTQELVCSPPSRGRTLVHRDYRSATIAIQLLF